MAAATPLLIGVVGDSGSGKTTLSASIVGRLGAHRVTTICLDDYHTYDRAERARRDITALHPDCNRLDLMAEHLHALRAGQSITKPVYNHADGTFSPDELLTPRDVVVVRGLLALHSAALRAAYHLTVFLDPDPALRVQWKIARDTAKRGYTSLQVLQHLARRSGDAERFIAPQRELADLVIMYSPGATGAPLGLRTEVRAPQSLSPRAVRALDTVMAAAERARWVRDSSGGRGNGETDHGSHPTRASARG
jgi:phosphoribulokinase